MALLNLMPDNEHSPADVNGITRLRQKVDHYMHNMRINTDLGPCRRNNYESINNVVFDISNNDFSLISRLFFLYFFVVFRFIEIATDYL